MIRFARFTVVTTLTATLPPAVGSAGAGFNTSTPAGSPTQQQSTLLTASDGGCDGRCSENGQHLTQADVTQIIAQVAAEAEARGLPGTAAVVDRVGNVLAVFEMNNAAKVVTITSSTTEPLQCSVGSKQSTSSQLDSRQSPKPSQAPTYPPRATHSAREPHHRSFKRTLTQGRRISPRARFLGFNLASFLVVIWFEEREPMA